MNENASYHELWIVLAIGTIVVALLVWWLLTGARNHGEPREKRKSRA